MLFNYSIVVIPLPFIFVLTQKFSHRMTNCIIYSISADDICRKQLMTKKYRIFFLCGIFYGFNLTDVHACHRLNEVVSLAPINFFF